MTYKAETPFHASTCELELKPTPESRPISAEDDEEPFVAEAPLHAAKLRFKLKPELCPTAVEDDERAARSRGQFPDAGAWRVQPRMCGDVC